MILRFRVLTEGWCAMLQILAAFGLRPGQLSSLRRVWNVSHWWVGRSTLYLGVATLVTGLAAKNRKHPWDAVPWQVFLLDILALTHVLMHGVLASSDG